MVVHVTNVWAGLDCKRCTLQPWKSLQSVTYSAMRCTCNVVSYAQLGSLEHLCSVHVLEQPGSKTAMLPVGTWRYAPLAQAQLVLCTLCTMGRNAHLSIIFMVVNSPNHLYHSLVSPVSMTVHCKGGPPSLSHAPTRSVEPVAIWKARGTGMLTK